MSKIDVERTDLQADDSQCEEQLHDTDDAREPARESTGEAHPNVLCLRYGLDLSCCGQPRN